MGFVFGLVMGVIVGLALIVGFVRSENARSKLRTELVSTLLCLLLIVSCSLCCLFSFSLISFCVLLKKATTIATFARMTVEDTRKLLSPEHYPSWVVFSQQQKVFSILF